MQITYHIKFTHIKDNDMQYKDRLPEKWAIKRTPDNYKIVNEWLDNNTSSPYSTYPGANRGYVCWPGPKGNILEFNNIRKDHTEISTEEFQVLVLGEKLKVSDLREKDRIHVSTRQEDGAIRQLCHEAGIVWHEGADVLTLSRWNVHKENTLLWPYGGLACGSNNGLKKDIKIYPASYFITTNNTTMNKEILGYKLKEEYLDMQDTCVSITKVNINYKATVTTRHEVIIGMLEKSGVLDLWFNPVYAPEQPKYSIGDWVTVVTNESNKNNHGNNDSWQVGDTFQIDRKDTCGNYQNTEWLIAKGKYGITANQVRPATKEEIEEAQKEVIQMAEGFQLTIRGKKVFHNTEDITGYVVDMANWVKNFPSNLGAISGINQWTLEIDDIIYSRTGCQQKETKLSQWLAIYDKIK